MSITAAASASTKHGKTKGPELSRRIARSRWEAQSAVSIKAYRRRRSVCCGDVWETRRQVSVRQAGVLTRPGTRYSFALSDGKPPLQSLAPASETGEEGRQAATVDHSRCAGQE